MSNKKKLDVLYDDYIPDEPIKLIDANKEFIGIFTKKEALQMARSQGYNLICQSSKLSPIICRIGDLKKYLYERNKQAKPSASVMKKVQVAFGIHEHDLNIKLNKCRKFLSSKDQVNIEFSIRRREAKVSTNIDKVNELIERCKEQLTEVAQITKVQNVTAEILNGSIILTPKKT